MPREGERLTYLDSIRGLAALSVLCSHYCGAYDLPPIVSQWVSNFPLSMCRDGFAGVSIFFVLSGLVLSLKYLRKGKNEYALSNVLGPFLIRESREFIFPLFPF